MHTRGRAQTTVLWGSKGVRRNRACNADNHHRANDSRKKLPESCSILPAARCLLPKRHLLWAVSTALSTPKMRRSNDMLAADGPLDNVRFAPILQNACASARPHAVFPTLIRSDTQHTITIYTMTRESAAIQNTHSATLQRSSRDQTPFSLRGKLNIRHRNAGLPP